jgi:small GTP-binding protein
MTQYQSKIEARTAENKCSVTFPRQCLQAFTAIVNEIFFCRRELRNHNKHISLTFIHFSLLGSTVLGADVHDVIEHFCRIEWTNRLSSTKKKFRLFQSIMTEEVPNLVVVGDGGVGKTCIILRYVRDMFSEIYDPTLEAHFQSEVTLPDGRTIAIQITDTAGQEDFASLRDLCMTEGNLFLVVFSVTEFKSLRLADELLERLTMVKDHQIHFVLAGNKVDIEKQRQVARADAEAIAAKYNGPFIECSALTRQGIKEVFQELARLWIDRPRNQKKCKKIRKRVKVENRCCEIL